MIDQIADLADEMFAACVALFVRGLNDLGGFFRNLCAELRGASGQQLARVRFLARLLGAIGDRLLKLVEWSARRRHVCGDFPADSGTATMG